MDEYDLVAAPSRLDQRASLADPEEPDDLPALSPASCGHEQAAGQATASQQETALQVAFVVYDGTTGEIAHMGRCARTILALQADAGLGQYAMEVAGWSPDTADVALVDLSGASPVLAPRPVMSPAVAVSNPSDGVYELSVANLPQACVVHVSGEEHEVTDGTFVLDTDQPGLYWVEVDGWPYRTWAQEVQVG